MNKHPKLYSHETQWPLQSGTHTLPSVLRTTLHWPWCQLAELPTPVITKLIALQRVAQHVSSDTLHCSATNSAFATVIFRQKFPVAPTKVTNMIRGYISCNSSLTFWRQIPFQILAHPVFKMWVIHKPNKVALWNKRHFEEKKGDYTACLKYSVRIFVE